MCTAIPWKAIGKSAALSAGRGTALTELKAKCFAPRHTCFPLLPFLQAHRAVSACIQACFKGSRSSSIVWAPARLHNCCGLTSALSCHEQPMSEIRSQAQFSSHYLASRRWHTCRRQARR